MTYQNLNQYQHDMRRFVKYVPQISMHYLLAGIAREAQELRQAVQAGDAFIDEQGDVLWFCASIARHCNEALSDYVTVDHENDDTRPLEWGGSDEEMAIHIEDKCGLILDMYVKGIRDYNSPVPSSAHRARLLRLVAGVLSTLESWLNGSSRTNLLHLAYLNRLKLEARKAAANA